MRVEKLKIYTYIIFLNDRRQIIAIVCKRLHWIENRHFDHSNENKRFLTDLPITKRGNHKIPLHPSLQIPTATSAKRKIRSVVILCFFFCVNITIVICSVIAFCLSFVRTKIAVVLFPWLIVVRALGNTDHPCVFRFVCFVYLLS